MKTLLFIILISKISFAGTSRSEAIRLKVREHIAEIESCYSPHATRPENEGKVVLDWEVDDTGTVIKASINDSQTTLKIPEFHSCIIDKLKTWKFPLAKKGDITAISYPFVFGNE